MVRVRPGSTDSSSSGETMTYSPPPRSYPFTTSAYSTSSPVRSLTRFWRTRSDVPAWNWLKWIALSSVAVNSPTGTLTKPKLRDPVQIALGISTPFPEGGIQSTTAAGALTRVCTQVHHPVTPRVHTGFEDKRTG